MQNSTLITSGIVSAICAAALTVQWRRNAGLERELETATEAVAELERLAVAPAADLLPGPVSALTPGAPEPGSIEAAIAEARAATTPEERIALALSRIGTLAGLMGEDDRSPAEIIRALPDLLRVVQDLDLEEMIAVAERIDAPLEMGDDATGEGVMKMVLLMLAADQDPQRLLENEEFGDSRELRHMILGSLARRDPEAAMAWVESAGLKGWERDQVERAAVMQLMRDDFPRALDFLASKSNDPQEVFQTLSMITAMGMAPELEHQITAAAADPANAELRDGLMKVSFAASVSTGGIEAAKARAQEFGLDEAGTAELLLGNMEPLLALAPAESMDWLAEVTPPERYETTLPNVIKDWARADFNAAGEWLGDQPASPARDGAIASYAELVVEVNPQAAATWTKEIGDDERRLEAVGAVMRHWQNDSPEEAAAWAEANGIPWPPAALQPAAAPVPLPE